MTTNIAVPELRRYAPDALRMVGIPLGQADETADMLVWTEAVHGAALRFVQNNRARLLWVPRPRIRVVTESADEVVLDARGGSLLEFGVRIFDFVCAEALVSGARRVRVRNVYGVVFLPYLFACSADRGVRVVADWDSREESLLDGSPESGIVLTLDATVHENFKPDGIDCPSFRDVVEAGIDLDEDDFASIVELWEMLRVPTSERSRSHAG